MRGNRDEEVKKQSNRFLDVSSGIKFFNGEVMEKMEQEKNISERENSFCFQLAHKHI